MICCAASAISLNVHAVSYTHLDVYKRQYGMFPIISELKHTSVKTLLPFIDISFQIDLVILDSKNKWVSVPLIPNLCAFVDVLFCLLNHYSKNSTWYFVLPPYFRWKICFCFFSDIVICSWDDPLLSTLIWQNSKCPFLLIPPPFMRKI